MNLTAIFSGLKLPADARRALDELVDTPEARAFLDRSDAARVARRREALAEIAQAEKQVEAQSAVTWQAVRDAEKAYAKAEADLHAAEARHRDAQTRNFAVGAKQRRAIMDAEQTLAETADSRLSEFRHHVLTIENMLRLTVRNTVHVAPFSLFGGPKETCRSNSDDVLCAVKLCRNCIDDLAKMAREALTRHDVTERLGDWSQSLAHAVRPFDLPWPALGPAGEVLPLGQPGSGAAPELREMASRQLEREARTLALGHEAAG